MLHLTTVSKELLGLLTFCMKRKEMSELRLVGGTALALLCGHRKSIDIDLFGKIDLTHQDVFRIQKEYSDKVEVLTSQRNIHISIVNGIKVDVVNYDYVWLGPCISEMDIRLASPEDIAAMKVNAIVGRGSKKDFIDLHLLLTMFTLEEIMGFYKAKYEQDSEFAALKSMLYFADAEQQAAPEMLQSFDWEQAKYKIRNEVERYMKEA